MTIAAPVRLQLSRRKGFKLQALSLEMNGLSAVSVARPSKYGNPFNVGSRLWPRELFGVEFVKQWAADLPEISKDRLYISAPIAVELFRQYVIRLKVDHGDAADAWLAPLTGKNLACYCKPGAPCHADILLQFANFANIKDRRK